MTLNEAYSFAWKALGHLVLQGNLKLKRVGVIYFCKEAERDGKFSFGKYTRLTGELKFGNFSLKESLQPDKLIFYDTMVYNCRGESWWFEVSPLKGEKKGLLSWFLDDQLTEQYVASKTARLVRQEIDMAWNYYENPALARKIKLDGEYRNSVREQIILEELKKMYNITLKWSK